MHSNSSYFTRPQSNCCARVPGLCLLHIFILFSMGAYSLTHCIHITCIVHDCQFVRSFSLWFDFPFSQCLFHIFRFAIRTKRAKGGYVAYNYDIFPILLFILYACAFVDLLYVALSLQYELVCATYWSWKSKNWARLSFAFRSFVLCLAFVCVSYMWMCKLATTLYIQFDVIVLLCVCRFSYIFQLFCRKHLHQVLFAVRVLCRLYHGTHYICSMSCCPKRIQTKNVVL